MPKYVLTVVTRGDNYIHSMHEAEEDAIAEQKRLLDRLNNPMKAAQEPFIQVGKYTVRLTDVERSLVSTEGEAPGLGGPMIG